MNRSVRLARADFKRRWSRPWLIATFVAIPVVSSLLMWMAFGGSDRGGQVAPLKMALVNRDPEGALEPLLRTALQQGDNADRFWLVTLKMEEARERLKTGEFSALLVIPPDFTRDYIGTGQPVLELIKNPTQMIYPEMARTLAEIIRDALNYLRAYLAEEFAQLQKEMEAGRATAGELPMRMYTLGGEKIRDLAGILQNPPVTVQTQRRDTGGEKDSRPIIVYIFPGFGFFFMFFIANSALTDYVKERKKFILKRLFVSRLTPAEYLLSRYGGAVIFVFCIEAVMSLLGYLLFSLTVGPLIPFLLFLVLGALLITAFFMIFAGIAQSERQMSNLSMVFIFFFGVIGGGIVPVSMLPELLEKLSVFSPIYHLKWGVISLIVQDMGQFRESLMVTLLVTAALLLISFYLNTRALRKVFQ